ncbi:P27 family phage terminase small subunit [Latilactobacillus curvatus]|uniref:P27 family phage terminase small subunit n=1 Tax=Latilactobacillus curvatus TaxID=28038 RepID=UPI0020C78A59|nr:P27 family phage terminase small subunit [Latilactobacillus curvatus]MCP8849174.1 P27 family phage terminase small subunit [Latilactobacillus curvatus]MCS8616374.1 terminase [Latilactobacillus curvatus]
MGRKQKLLSQSKGNLTVLQQEAKYKAEFNAADGLPNLQKTPPKHLDSVAKNEYKRIINSLGNLPLRNLDRVELETYCSWYSIYKSESMKLQKIANQIPALEKNLEVAYEELQQAQLMDSTEMIKEAKINYGNANGWVEDAEFKRDRAISHLDKATKNIKGLASDLGLNVNSRMQMNMPKDEEKTNSLKGMFS